MTDLALDYLYRGGELTLRPEGNPVVVPLDLKMPRLDGVQQVVEKGLSFPLWMKKLEGVIPAKAGIHCNCGLLRKRLDSRLLPAFAGMTGNDEISPSLLHLISTVLNFFNILLRS